MESKSLMRSEPELLLRNLPRAAASPHFTARVLARLHREEDHRPMQRVLRTALAAAVMLILAVTVHLDQQRQHADIARDLQSVRSELTQISKATPEPLILIGGTEDVDYVIDLRASNREVPADLESAYY